MEHIKYIDMFFRSDSSFTTRCIVCQVAIARSGYERFGGTYYLHCQGRVLLTWNWKQYVHPKMLLFTY
jgi:hypothetical protein